MDFQEKPRTKIFSLLGSAVIFCFLAGGIYFAHFQKTGAIEKYYENKYPVLPFKFPEIRKYKIGFVTDAHSRTTKKGMVRPESELPMLEFVNRMNGNFKPDFVIDGGDFIDGTRRLGAKSMQDYSAFSKIFETVEAPKYKVLGNHELRGMTREDWIKLNNYEKSYYYFDYGNLRIIVFDSTLMPGVDNLPEDQRVFEEELAWLEDVLKNSERHKKIIFSHNPYIPALRKSVPLERIEKFNEIASKYRVRAVFSGHVEVPYYEKIGGVDYFVTPGFFRSEATGMLWKDAFSEITIGRKNFLTLYYRNEPSQEYQSLNIPSAEYDIAKKTIAKKVNFLAPNND